MSGLLDIWNNYWDMPQHSGANTTFDDEWRKKKLRRGETERSNLSTAGGVEPTGNIIPRQHLKRGQSISQGNTGSVPFQSRMTGQGPQVNENISRGELARNLALTNPNVANVSKSGKVTYKQDVGKTPNLYQDKIMQGGTDINQDNTDPRWWHKLANMANVDFDKAMASWKDKGGFEGLMANPAFTMGLAFMQASAEGKTIGQGALDNVMKAAGISSHYKKIIEDRKQEPIQATAADIDEVKTMLDRVKLKEPNMWEKALGWVTGDNVTAKYDRAAEAVAVAYQEEIAAMQRAHKGTKPFVIDDTVKEKALLKVLKDKRVKQKDGWAIFGPFTSGTIQKGTTLPKFKAQGGPVARGQPYVVGEGGPEYFLPQESGKVLSNDDSRIFSMLLSANPQLQNVSRTRAEKILRNRFPEYFE